MDPFFFLIFILGFNFFEYYLYINKVFAVLIYLQGYTYIHKKKKNKYKIEKCYVTEKEQNIVHAELRVVCILTPFWNKIAQNIIQFIKAQVKQFFFP